MSVKPQLHQRPHVPIRTSQRTPSGGSWWVGISRDRMKLETKRRFTSTLYPSHFKTRVWPESADALESAAESEDES